MPRDSIVVPALLWLIRGYALVRAILPVPPLCRFWPSCSRYAAEALRQHGAARGLRLALSRLLRCHPLHPGGCDPVPR